VAHEQDIESIVGQFYASLCRFALSLTRNEVEACDLTQQTFFRLARRSHQIRDTKKIRCWLYTTLRRDFFQPLRAETSHLTIEFRPEIHDIPSFTDEVARALDAKTVLEALSQIEPAFRTPVELFYVGEMSYLEIAESLKIPVGTLMSRISRGKDQLKTILVATTEGKRAKAISFGKRWTSRAMK
jgi:RNA polymerase sigma-70 factor (ECF subfamily)